MVNQADKYVVTIYFKDITHSSVMSSREVKSHIVSRSLISGFKASLKDNHERFAIINTVDDQQYFYDKDMIASVVIESKGQP